ncbi:MAG TPA: hypothetical protein VK929_07125 [Longimicrobiales bacterium]|nr:hypothetical protein [Longimicrobiales bacterium]
MRAEQAALQQGLQQLSRNLQETAQRGGTMSREVSNALARANMSMQQTQDALQRGELPLDQAQQTVDALNRLALSLLNNSQQAGGVESASGTAMASQQLADLSTRQGSVNGQTSAMSPMNLSAGAMADQLERLAREQAEIAERLGSVDGGARDAGLGDELDALVREAEELARQLQGGSGLTAETLARQERLFHRLLDAGRSLEKEEYEDERTGERPTGFTPRAVEELDGRLFADPTRFPVPTAEELRSLPAAQRRLILDYFERLNRPAPPAPGAVSRP